MNHVREPHGMLSVAAGLTLFVLGLAEPISAQGTNHAIRLNGIDAYGTAAGVGGLVANSTWEAWIRIPQAPIGGGCVLSRWGMYSHALSVNEAAGTISVDMYSCWTSACPQTTSPPDTLQSDRWHHIALVYGPQAAPSAEAYVDGRLVAWCGPQGCTPYAGWETILGAFGYTGYSTFFQGEIDEARISNVPRYSGSFTPPIRFTSDSNTVGLWHFDEGNGSVAYDSSGSNRHFSLHGGFSWAAGNGSSSATFSTFGTGCAGAFGIPTLAAANGSRPTIGTTFQMQLANLPPSPFNVVFGLVGYSNSSTAGVPLPRSLSVYGLPAACTQYIDPFSGLTQQIVNRGGQADWGLPIPNAPYLQGFPIYLQGFVFDWQLTSPVPAIVTNAGEAVLQY